MLRSIRSSVGLWQAGLVPPDLSADSMPADPKSIFLTERLNPASEQMSNENRTSADELGCGALLAAHSEAMKERDDTRRWLLEIAKSMNVELPNSEGRSVHEAWEALKDEFLAANVRAMSLPAGSALQFQG